MAYYLYILKSKIKPTYYIGSTENIQRRLEEHNKGKNSSNRAYRPWGKIYTEEYKTSKEARQREYQIKKKKRKAYIEWLIKNKHSGPVV